MDVKIYSDGGARGNPGPSASAAFVFDGKSNDLLKLDAKFLGTATNNQAEYEGLYLGLKMASKLGAKNVVCCLDSELVVKQLKGEYKVKDSKMKSSKKKVDEMIGTFDSVEFKHIPREENSFADSLVNLILDSANADS